jgi:transketolase
VAAARPATLVVTVEEHWRNGGLGGAVAETLAEEAPTRVLRMGVLDQFVDAVGNQEQLITYYDLTAERVVRTVRAGLDTAACSRITDRKDSIT